MPCACVFREIFRTCLRRFRDLQDDGEPFGRPSGRSFPGPEYCADFVNIARRTLGEGSRGWNVFRLHHLLGGDCVALCRVLRIERGAYYHEVYRVEQKLGLAFVSNSPCALFPLSEYFSGRRAA